MRKCGQVAERRKRQMEKGAAEGIRLRLAFLVHWSFLLRWSYGGLDGGPDGNKRS